MTVLEKEWERLLDSLDLESNNELELVRFEADFEGWQVELTKAGEKLALEHNLKNSGN